MLDLQVARAAVRVPGMVRRAARSEEHRRRDIVRRVAQGPDERLRYHLRPERHRRRHPRHGHARFVGARLARQRRGRRRAAEPRALAQSRRAAVGHHRPRHLRSRARARPPLPARLYTFDGPHAMYMHYAGDNVQRARSDHDRRSAHRRGDRHRVRRERHDARRLDRARRAVPVPLPGARRRRSICAACRKTCRCRTSRAC